MKWLLVIAAIGLVLFYSRKMPDLARSLGSSVRAFREGKNRPDAGLTPSKQDSEKSAKTAPPR
jgi:TatA/E family protein of Tat protein translocase